MGRKKLLSYFTWPRPEVSVLWVVHPRPESFFVDHRKPSHDALGVEVINNNKGKLCVACPLSPSLTLVCGVIQGFVLLDDVSYLLRSLEHKLIVGSVECSFSVHKKREVVTPPFFLPQFIT